MRSILFDIDGVLIEGGHTGLAKSHRWNATLSQDLGLPQDALEPFFAETFPNVICGHLQLEEALTVYLTQIGSPVSARTLIEYWMPRNARVNKKLWDLTTRLHATGKVKLFIATNQEHIRAAYLWHEVGFKEYFDDMFYAAALKAMKPSPAFFAACNARLPASESPPLFFDDDPAYVQGARQAGWEAYVYEKEQVCLNHPFIKTVLDS